MSSSSSSSTVDSLPCSDWTSNILERIAGHEGLLTNDICDYLKDSDILHLCQASRTMFTIFSPILQKRFAELLKTFSTRRPNGGCHIHLHAIPPYGGDEPAYQYWCTPNVSLTSGPPVWRRLWSEQVRKARVGDLFWVFHGVSTTMGERTALCRYCVCTPPCSRPPRCISKDFDPRLAAIYEAVLSQEKQQPELSLVTTTTTFAPLESETHCYIGEYLEKA